MKKYLRNVRFLTQAGLIAAIYAALCLLLRPISFGEVQLRVSEALTLLPVLTPAAVPGLFLGCFIANLMGGAMIPDLVFGSIATLLAAIFTRKLREKPCLAALPPVLFNAVIIGLVLRYAYGVALPLWICMGSVGLGQLIACYALGLPLMRAMKRVPEKYFSVGSRS